jgi:hypothetical protein
MTLVYAITILTALALVAGATYLWRRGAPRMQIALMLILALVMIVNVAIWTLPGDEQVAPLQQVPQ